MRVLFLSVIFYYTNLDAQNHPSLIKGKNINSTFCIVAYDSIAQEWGIAVATNNICVGNSTVYIQPGLGAFSVIAETEPAYALNGFAALKAGKSIRDAIESTMKSDSEVYSRQVSGLDAAGNCFVFTGSTWKYQKGFAGSRTGKGYVVMGNQLGDSVLQQMSASFEKTSGTLASRLLAALIAGQAAGGQIEGKQSAALVVKGTNNDFFNNIDLRVDDSKDPFRDLQRLLNYQYGRIRLNQAVFALKMGNKTLGKTRLSEAREMVKGWNGMQAKVTMAYILAGEDSEAVHVIRKALAENPQWKEYLPAFYLLKDEPGMKGLIDGKLFTEKDWSSAVSLLGELNRDPQSVAVCQKALILYPRSSYLHYLLGQSLLNEGKTDDANKALQEAVSLDCSNEEAVMMIQQHFK
jgi:uncharacterized Ntn-hydrolase superfamily protein